MLNCFFTYFGGKWRLSKYYSPPKFSVVVEPFAGSAGYSLRYYNSKVRLYDLNPFVTETWDYLIKVKSSELLRLPLKVEHVDDVKAPDGAKWLIGFWLGRGGGSPSATPCSWMRSGKYDSAFWGEHIRARLAHQVNYIRHWRVFHKSYEFASNRKATWFVDPPYEKEGAFYKVKFNDYKGLSRWCHDRKGQLIVCEQLGARWMPFKVLKEIRGMNKRSVEVVYETTTQRTG